LKKSQGNLKPSFKQMKTQTQNIKICRIQQKQYKVGSLNNECLHKKIRKFLHKYLFFKNILIIVLGRGMLWHYKKSYNISDIAYLNSPTLSFSFICPTSRFWNIFNKCHFPT
jgi:hypothetical protein